MRNILALLLAAACIPGVRGGAHAFNMPSQASDGQAAAHTDIVTIKRQFKVGDVDRYSLKLQQKVSGAASGNPDADIVFNLVFKQSVKSVANNGLLSLQDEFVKADGTINGTSMDVLTKTAKMKLTVDQTSHTEITSEGGEEPVAQQFSQIVKILTETFAAATPIKTVHTGDSWITNITGTGADAGGKVTLKFTFVSQDTLNGNKVLKIKIVSDSEGGAQADSKMHGEGEILLDASNFKPLRMSTKSSGTAAGNVISGELTLELVPPDQKVKDESK